MTKRILAITLLVALSGVFFINPVLSQVDVSIRLDKPLDNDTLKAFKPVLIQYTAVNESTRAMGNLDSIFIGFTLNGSNNFVKKPNGELLRDTLIPFGPWGQFAQLSDTMTIQVFGAAPSATNFCAVLIGLAGPTIRTGDTNPNNNEACRNVVYEANTGIAKGMASLWNNNTFYSHGQLHIRLGSDMSEVTTPVKLRISSLTGQLVFEKSLSTDIGNSVVSDIEINDLPDAIYIYTLELNNDQIVFDRFMKH